MRVMRQRRAPGVKDQRRTDASAQMLGICGDGLQHFGGHIEQQPLTRPDSPEIAIVRLTRATISAHRPKPARRAAPKQPDAEPSLFFFGFYEAAVRDLTDPAIMESSP